jgi:hypothetical protein
MADRMPRQSSQGSLAFSVREDDLEELEQFAADLRNRVHDHKEKGGLYMMQKYTEILAGVSSEVRKIRARFDRESIADMRRTHKELKAQARGDEEE